MKKKTVSAGFMIALLSLFIAALAAGCSSAAAGAVTYRVTYNANGAGSGSVPVDSTVYEGGETVTVLGNTGSLARSGYLFLGWAASASATAADYQSGDTFALGSASVTLYAVWTDTWSFTVTFDSQGADTAASPASVTVSNPALTVGDNMPTDPAKSSGAFQGWYTQENGGGEEFTSSTNVSSDLTVYAAWGYTLSFDANGGEGSMDSLLLDEGDSVTLANTFTRSGYFFQGWNTSATGDGTSYEDGVSFTIGASDVTLYAQWLVDSPPAAVTNLTITKAGKGEIDLEWTDPEDSDLDHILITWDPNGSAGTTVAAGTQALSITGLTTGTEYTITVQAVDAGGNASDAVECDPVTLYDSTLRDVAYVGTGAELAAMASDLDAYYILTADIDLSGYSTNWTPVGSSSAPFTGVIDGKGYTISNLKTTTNSTYRGLIGYASSAYLTNLTLTGVSIASTSDYAGGLVAYLQSGTVKGCSVAGSVGTYNSSKGYYHGGLIGGLGGTATLYDCHAQCDVGGCSIIGGCVGYANAGGTCSMTLCSAEGTISGEYKIGGFVGTISGYERSNYFTLSQCYASAIVTSSTQSGGGLCGECVFTNINDCYSVGSVSCPTQIGGLCGYCSGIAAARSYASCSLSGSYYKGALVGYYSSGTFTNCYYNSSVYSASSYGSGLSSTAMLDYTNFSGFDFTSTPVWAIDTGASVNSGYPYLYANQP